ncbi:MAG: sigma-70 family RNA polymerase sigma factor [Phycisphaeraceae bacterium]|nr:sigma-70 family RNA polymerase sigma factor [Phycisphaerales bacterium]MCB9843666.1 sigma-70 family RNA polymerase sigma factor [Phycisphaeraceae bacterium]
MANEGSITRLLAEVAEGRAGAEDRLFVRVYDELRVMASARLGDERAFSGGAGDPEDLVHDAYARVVGETLVNRRQLFFMYARAMRQILVDRARRNLAAKRGGDRHRVMRDPETMADEFAGPGLDVMDIDDLLTKLRVASEREADVVELRYFGGLSDTVVGQLLGVSERTVRNDWSSARERLRGWLADDGV